MKNYHLIKEFKNLSESLFSLLFLPKQNLLIYGTFKNCIHSFSLTLESIIQTINLQDRTYFNFYFLNDNSFISRQSIKNTEKEVEIEETLWSIKENSNSRFNIESKNITKPPKWLKKHNIMEEQIIVCELENDEGFDIRDYKSGEILKIFKEDIKITAIKLLKNNIIITITKNNTVNIWKIS
jgi:hypothetical protein